MGAVGSLAIHWREPVARQRVAYPEGIDATPLAYELVGSLTVGDDAQRGKRARPWAKGNSSVPILLRRLGCLREVLTELPGAERAERLPRVLDTVVTAATETVMAELSDAALTDPLTGIGNRRAFEHAAQIALAQADRGGHVVFRAALDLQGLKEINDTRGHAAGAWC